MRHFLDFERPIAELEGKIEELRHLSTENGLNIAEEVGRLAGQVDRRAVFFKHAVGLGRRRHRPRWAGAVSLTSGRVRDADLARDDML